MQKLRKVNMEPFNNNIKNNNQTNSGKKNGTSKTFKHTDSTLRRLPSISYMLTSVPFGNKIDNGIGIPLETKNIDNFHSVKQGIFHSSPPISPTAPESAFQPSNYQFRIPTSHKRTSSLESLLSAAENAICVDPIVDSKIISLQRLKQRIIENMNFLEEKYSENFNQHVPPFKKEEIYKTLRNLQELSVELYEIVTSIIDSKEEPLETKQSSIFASSPTQTEIVKDSTAVFPQPQTTLLPPLILKENPQTAQRLSEFKFPAINSHLSTTNGNYTNYRRKFFSEKESHNTFLPTTNSEQKVQDQSSIFTEHNPILHTPQKKIYSNETSNFDVPTIEHNVVVKNQNNKFGNSITIFPKNKSGKSTIITPVSQRKTHISRDSKGNVGNIFIPPLNFEKRTVTLTPKSSREEYQILPEIPLIESDTTMDIPYNVKKLKTGLITKNSTPKKGTPVGITTTLKLANNLLLEKSIKKYKRRENPERTGTYLKPWKSIAVEKHFENKRPMLQIQDMKKKESFKNLEEEESNKRCFHCQSSKTPEWRAGPYGCENICNACGLFYRKIVSKFGEKGGNLLMKYRQQVCPTNRRVPPYIEIPEEYMAKFSKESGFDKFSD